MLCLVSYQIFKSIKDASWKNNKKKIVNNLYYADIKLPVSKKDYRRTENKNISINVFCYKNDLVYPVDVSDEKNWKMYRSFVEKKNTVVELLFKKLFCRNCLQCFSSNKFLLEHKTFFENKW